MLFLRRLTWLLTGNACSVMSNCPTIDLRTIRRLNRLGSASEIEVFFENSRLVRFVQFLIGLRGPEVGGLLLLFVVRQQIVEIPIFNRL